MEKKEMITRLEEFNNEAKEMFSLDFVKNPQVAAYSLHHKKTPKFDYNGPIIEKDSVKAICNDLRKFFQNDEDALCLGHLEPIYTSELVDDTAKTLFKSAKDRHMIFEQRKTPIILQGHNPTYGEVFHVFLYGKISHRSQRTGKKGKSLMGIYEQWRKSDLIAPLTYEFIIALRNYVEHIGRIVKANELALRNLKS